MAESLLEFIERFVLPLHEGGAVVVGPPLGVRDRERFADEAGLLFDDRLRGVRLQRASALMPAAPLPDPDLSDLSLWMGLHNLLTLDHPDRDRVWARVSTWEVVVQATRALIHFSAPTDLAEQLARHVSVQCFLDLVRVDQVARVDDQSRRFAGQPAPRGVRRMASIGEIDLSEERVLWADVQHAPEVDLLTPELMFVSPMTALLDPTRVRRPFDPRSPARWLRTRAGARAVVHAWARQNDWVETGAAITGNLLLAIGRADLLGDDELSGPRPPRSSRKQEGDELFEEVEETEDPAALQAGGIAMLGASQDYGAAEHAALLGALIHLHFLKVLAFEARVSLGGRKSRFAARAFLALPLMLPRLVEALGDPLVGVEDPDALRRWDDYLAHLRGLVPLDALENLVAALVAPVVQKDAA